MKTGSGSPIPMARTTAKGNLGEVSNKAKHRLLSVGKGLLDHHTIESAVKLLLGNQSRSIGLKTRHAVPLIVLSGCGGIDTYPIKRRIIMSSCWNRDLP